MEELTWMVCEQIKRCLIVLAVKEKENKITVKYHLTSHKRGKQENILLEYVRQQEHPSNTGESGDEHNFFGDNSHPLVMFNNPLM